MNEWYWDCYKNIPKRVGSSDDLLGGVRSSPSRNLCIIERVTYLEDELLHARSLFFDDLPDMGK